MEQKWVNFKYFTVESIWIISYINNVNLNSNIIIVYLKLSKIINLFSSSLLYYW